MNHCTFCPSTVVAIETLIDTTPVRLCPMCAEEISVALGVSAVKTREQLRFRFSGQYRDHQHRQQTLRAQ